MARIEYYEGKTERGVIYDWKKIRKEFDKLGTPPDLYYPCFKAIEDGNKIIHSLSIRSTGKTTQWLLVGLCMAKLYKGMCIQYVRTTEEELTPTWASKLVEVIRTYNDGQYIKRLTDDEYNDIYYHWRQFFYCYRDPETGDITKKSDIPIIQCLAVSIEESYKSSYNSSYGMGDFFLYDEYITKSMYPNAFFHFFNLFKTVSRNRKSPVIVMCANTTNLFSQWFEEFGISKEVKTMKQGDSKSIVTKKGTKLYIEYIALTGETSKKNREELNRLFFGFENPKLSSITGSDDWSFDYYPHIPPTNEENPVKIYRSNIYIDFNTELYRIKLCKDNTRGIHARIHRATRTYDDSIILTLDLNKVSENKNYQYGFGYSKKLRKIFSQIIEQKRLYFSTNEVGSAFYEYFKQYKMSR